MRKLRLLYLCMLVLGAGCAADRDYIRHHIKSELDEKKREGAGEGIAAVESPREESLAFSIPVNGI